MRIWNRRETIFSHDMTWASFLPFERRKWRHFYKVNDSLNLEMTRMRWEWHFFASFWHFKNWTLNFEEWILIGLKNIKKSCFQIISHNILKYMHCTINYIKLNSFNLLIFILKKPALLSSHFFFFSCDMLTWHSLTFKGRKNTWYDDTFSNFNWF